MPINSRGQRVNTHKTNNANKQKAQASALRKPQYSTGGTAGGASVGGGS
jgi:hypothetical protein